MTNDKARSVRERTRSQNRSRAKRIGLPALLVLALFAGCSEKTSNTLAPAANPAAAALSATNAASEIGRQVFEVRGVVQEVLAAKNQLVIKHEAIPNYMPAMTMTLDVRTTNDIVNLATNDQITFKMVVTDADGWIEDVRKIGVADATSQGQEPRPRTRLVRDVQPLAVGDKMPNYPFTNSLGEKFELKELAGQAYAITFIFTRCPFPTFCPRMNTNFEQAYEQLKKTPNAPTNWHLVSISFDPDFDTPERLKEYSKTYKPDPTKWSWVTGVMIEIDAITEQLGVVFAFENGTINHNLRTAVVDKNGVIRQIFWGNEWTAEELVKELVAGAEGKEVGKF